MTDFVIEARDLRKRFPAGRGAWVHAVNGVSFQIRRGERVGLVGESGCGKSTLASLLLLLDSPDAGSLSMLGKDSRSIRGGALKEFRRRVQMVFQDPLDSLNPQMRVGEIIEEPLLLQGIPRGERRDRVRRMMDRVLLAPDLADRKPAHLSGGQQQRVGIARALVAGAEVLVLDEPTSSLDASVRSEILGLLDELQADLRLTYLFISHDLWTVRSMCDRVMVMYLGKVVESAPTSTLFVDPEHPYSRALIGAALLAGVDRLRQRVELSGDPPSPVNLPRGCYLAARCPMVNPECLTHPQELVSIADNHEVACEVVVRGRPDRKLEGVR